MRKFLLLPFALFVFTTLVAQTAPKNFTLVGSRAYASQLNDVCAYVDGSNNEYAIVGHEDGVSIVSLSNPANPTQLFNLPGINTIWREIDVYQTYAYVCNEAGDGLRIIDLSGLPASVNYKDTVIAGSNTGHSLMVEGNRLYIHGADIDNGGISILSLADPWRPSHIGAYTDFYVHDAYFRNDTAYAGEIYDGYLKVIDMNNPSNPTPLGSVQTPDQFTHNAWLNDAGTVCFTTDEVDGAVIAAYDITDLSNLVEIDRVCSSVSSCQSPPHNVKVLNDYLVTSYYRDGVHLVDAARPHNLIEMGWYDTSPLSGGGFNGAWSSDPYLPSGLVLVGDMEEGLFVVQPNYLRGCYLEGIVTDSITGLTLPGALVEILTTTASDITAADGTYATGVADAASLQARYSKFGYITKTINITMSNGVLNVQNVELAPLPTVNYTINVVEEGTLTPIPNAEVLVEETGNGGTNSYTANGAGIVNDPGFVQGTYDIYAGKWGWKTVMVNTTANPGNASITIELPKGYYDDFFFDYNWISTNLNASSGDWERGEPDGTQSGGGNQYNPDLDVTNDFGDQAYVTGNGGGQPGDDDVDQGEVALESPVLNLSTYNEPILRYYRWFANGGGFGSNPDDTLRVEISNGFSVVTVDRVFGTNANNWVLDSVRISDYLTPTANMIVRFVAGDYNDGHICEGAVDKIEVYDANPTSVKNAHAAAQLMVFPNPMNQAPVVKYEVNAADAHNLRFVLTDLTGRVVMTTSLSSSKGEFVLENNLPAGVYIGGLESNGKSLSTLKLVR